MNESKQLPPKKRETTRGRQLSFLAAYINGRFNASEACRTIGIGRTTFYKWQKSERFQLDLENARQDKLDNLESALYRNCQAGDTTAIIFSLKTIGKTRGYIEAEKVRTGEIPAKRAVEILDQLLAGTIDAITAALQFSREGLPLSEALRVLLAKFQLEPPPPDSPPSMSDEELESGYLKKMSEIDDQKKTWLPKRKIEVEELKGSLKDFESFGPDAKKRPIERST